MANIRPSSTISDIRGKIGSEVYARNSAGLYVRSVGSWVQPDSQRQLDARAAITLVSQAWSGTLTEQQRSTWRQYARAWPMPNKLGDPVVTSGQPYFTRCNAYPARAHSTLPYLSAPPAGPLAPPMVTFTTDPGSDQLTVTLHPTNYDPPTRPLTLWLFVGQPVTVGTSFYRHPWRYAGTNTYNAGWASTPWTVATPWSIDIDQRLWIYVVAQDTAGGQLSRPFYTRMNT